MSWRHYCETEKASMECDNSRTECPLCGVKRIDEEVGRDFIQEINELQLNDNLQG